MQEKRDIFDRMMALPLLNIFEPFYKKNKEVLLYLFFGGLTFIVSIVTYAVFNVSMGINELIANVMSWVLAVLFAFATNRVWVFQAPTHTITEFLRQMLSFFGGRVVTLVIEEIILLVFITWLGFNSMVVKVVAQVILIAALTLVLTAAAVPGVAASFAENAGVSVCFIFGDMIEGY